MWTLFAKLRYSPYSPLLIMISLSFADLCAAEKPSKARVVIVAHTEAARDASNPKKYFHPQQAAINQMVSTGIRNWTGQQNVKAAWKNVAANDEVIGIKVSAAPGPVIGTRPAVVRAVIQQLLESGVPGQNIVVWDKHLNNLHEAGFIRLARDLGVCAEGAVETGYERLVNHDVALHYPLARGDLDFGKKRYSRHSHPSKLITQRLDTIIQISSLLHHPETGVQGNLYGLSIEACDNTLRFKLARGFIKNAVPDLFNMVNRRGLTREKGFKGAMDLAIKRGGAGIKQLLPPGVTTQHKFFYRAVDPLMPMAPLQAWRFALKDALETDNKLEATVEILHPNGVDASLQTFYPDGHVEYFSLLPKASLHITDALLCQYLAGEVRLQYSSVLNELRFSSDPVALDVLSLIDIERLSHKRHIKISLPSRELYENAAGIDLGSADPSRIKIDRVNLPSDPSESPE